MKKGLYYIEPYMSVKMDTKPTEAIQHVVIVHDNGQEFAKMILHTCQTPENAYRDAIVRLIDRQRAKGMEKYGQTLEENTTLTTEQRIEHAQEELVDALQYLEHLKQAQADQLTANDYQRAAMRTASGMDSDEYDGRGLLMNAVMGLNGEAGEVIDHVKKVCFQGHELDRLHLIEELGDVAWYLAVCCEAIDTSLEEVLQNNIDKLRKRYPDGFDKSRSINREEHTEDVTPVDTEPVKSRDLCKRCAWGLHNECDEYKTCKECPMHSMNGVAATCACDSIECGEVCPYFKSYKKGGAENG